MDRPFSRAQRVMRGFTAEMISVTKLPLPESVVFAITDCLLGLFGWQAAFAAWLQHDTHVGTVTLLRVRFCDFTDSQPHAGVLCSTRWSLVVAPQARRQPTMSSSFSQPLIIAGHAGSERSQHWLARTVF